MSHGTKELPVYALVVAKNGSKLHEAKPGDTYPKGLKGSDGRPIGHPNVLHIARGQLIGQGIPIGTLAMLLSFQLDRTVLDQTGLKGNYDVTLLWTPDEASAAMTAGPGGGASGAGAAPPPESSGPSLFTAIQEQLGLKLESTKGPVEVLVIEHIERPSEN
ncbi:MAG: TIGR03435 family protein [Terriglobia bacterium]